MICSKLKNSLLISLTSSAGKIKLIKYSNALFRSVSFLSLKNELIKIPLLICAANEYMELSIKTIFFILTFLKIRRSLTVKESLKFMQLFRYNLNLINLLSGSKKLITASAYSFTEAVKIPTSKYLLTSFKNSFTPLRMKIPTEWIFSFSSSNSPVPHQVESFSFSPKISFFSNFSLNFIIASYLSLEYSSSKSAWIKVSSKSKRRIFLFDDKVGTPSEILGSSKAYSNLICCNWEIWVRVFSR